MDTYRKRHDTGRAGRPVFWSILGLLYAASFGLVFYFVKVPTSYAMRIGLEAGLFFLSVILLDMYMQAFAVLSMRPTNQVERFFRPNPFIIACWVLSVIYHLSMGLLTSRVLPDAVYYGGFVFTLGLLLVTIVHYFARFAFGKGERKIQEEEEYAREQRQVLEMIRDTQSDYYWIRDVMDNHEDVRQMMVWNGFDRMLEEQIYDLQPYFQRTVLTNRDMDRVAGIRAWFESMRRIVEEHPNYQQVQTRAADSDLPLRQKRKNRR